MPVGWGPSTGAGRAWSTATTKLVESIARAVTRVRHWCSLSGPGAHEDGNRISSAPRLASRVNRPGKRTS